MLRADVLRADVLRADVLRADVCVPTCCVPTLRWSQASSRFLPAGEAAAGPLDADLLAAGPLEVAARSPVLPIGAGLSKIGVGQVHVAGFDHVRLPVVAEHEVDEHLHSGI